MADANQTPTAQITIGLNNIEIASDDSGSSTERVASINSEPATEFECKFTGCERYCTTKNGRGLHQHTAHKAWYDECILDVSVPYHAQTATMLEDVLHTLHVIACSVPDRDIVQQ